MAAKITGPTAAAAGQLGVVYTTLPMGLGTVVTGVDSLGNFAEYIMLAGVAGTGVALGVVWGVGFVLPVHYIVHPYRRAAGLINQAGYTIGGALVIGAISVFYSALSELPTGNPFIEFVRDYGIKTPMNGWVMEIVLGGVAGFFYSLFSGMEVTPLLDEKTRKKAGLPEQLTFGKM